MEYYKYIAVVLVYRNVDDLKECINSFLEKINSIKVIVVNAYYDDKSERLIREIAEESRSDYINIENKGYSYGNNSGIRYALSNYRFDYIIVSNPDIVIDTFNDKEIRQESGYDIYAPKIITISGRNQNPMSIIRNKASECLEYCGYKLRSSFFLLAGIGINKIIRAVTILIKGQSKKPYKIYCAHGSFVILSKKAIEALNPVYDEKVFLFAEEGILAIRARRLGIATAQIDSIIINHKEDGSMKLSNISENEEMRKSNIYYYETYVR